MRKLALALLLSAMCVAPAEAQFSSAGIFKGRAAAAPSYTGPGDVNTFSSWYSCSYAYSAATRGTNSCRVCDAATGLICVNVASDATTGIVPNPSISGTPCAGTACVVDTFYDKAGGGRDMVQSTNGNRAVWVPAGSCTGFGAGISCVKSNTNTGYTVASWTLAQPYSLAWVVRRDAGTGTNTDVFYSNSNEFGAGFFGANDDAVCYAGSGGLNPTATDANPHAVSCSVDSPSSNIRVDSTNTAGNPGTGTFSGVFSLLWNGNTGDRNWLGFFVSGGVAASSFSTTNLTNQNSNAHTNGGF